MSDQDQIDRAFARAKFFVEFTGGGCNCFRRDDGAHVLIVTEEGDATRPDSLDRPITVGRYTRENWQEQTGNAPLSVEDFDAAQAFLARWI